MAILAVECLIGQWVTSRISVTSGLYKMSMLSPVDTRTAFICAALLAVTSCSDQRASQPLVAIGEDDVAECYFPKSDRRMELNEGQRQCINESVTESKSLEEFPPDKEHRHLPTSADCWIVITDPAGVERRIGLVPPCFLRANGEYRVITRPAYNRVWKSLAATSAVQVP